MKLLGVHNRYRARARWTFWTPLTIQCGVTVSRDGDVKSYAKTEARGVMRMPFGGGWNAPNHKSGHLDEDSIWTPI